MVGSGPIRGLPPPPASARAPVASPGGQKTRCPDDLREVVKTVQHVMGYLLHRIDYMTIKCRCRNGQGDLMGNESVQTFRRSDFVGWKARTEPTSTVAWQLRSEGRGLVELRDHALRPDSLSLIAHRIARSE